MVDHVAEKDSAVDLVDTVQNVIMEMRRERARMEYLCSAVENVGKKKWFGGLVRAQTRVMCFRKRYAVLVPICTNKAPEISSLRIPNQLSLICHRQCKY